MIRRNRAFIAALMATAVLSTSACGSEAVNVETSQPAAETEVAASNSG